MTAIHPIGFNFPEDLKTPWAGAVEPFEPAGDQHLALGAELGEAGEGGGERGSGHGSQHANSAGGAARVRSR